MSDFLDVPATAKYLGMSVRSIDRWRITGTGPAYVRVGPRKIFYRISDINAWLESRVFASAEEEKQKTESSNG